MRTALRRLRFGLATLLGVSRRGFFIPYRYADRLPGPGERSPYPAMESLFAERREAFLEILGWLESLTPDLAAIGGEAPPAPRWDQDWFPRLDAAVAYALVRRHRPVRILEVGSGHSTRFLARAVADEAYPARITAIDPQPRADLAGLPIEFLRAALPAAGEAAFRDLAPGDVLMIDSSHILMPGSDADFLFGRVLPSLPTGVYLHIHDIFLPDDYPADWDWRGYNEQLGVMTLLQGGAWELLFSSHYVVSRMAESLADSPVAKLPLRQGARESSLWLIKRGSLTSRDGLTSRGHHEDM
jgi:hypothetical protein